MAGRILAIHPPGEVQQQLREALPQEREVHLAQVGLQVRQEQRGEGVDRGFTSPKFHSYAGIWPLEWR